MYIQEIELKASSDHSLILQPIAQKMGLNLQTCKLWKDKAIVELNIAILHSFQVRK